MSARATNCRPAWAALLCVAGLSCSPSDPAPTKSAVGAAWPGLEMPPTVPADTAQLADDAPVAGVVVNGRPRAYSLQSMSQPQYHVLNDVLAGRAVSVTYCDRTDCLRAFSAPSPRPLPVWLEGWSGDEMLISLDSQVFSQNEAPLAAWEVEHTTWSQWRAGHPDTDVFVGR